MSGCIIPRGSQHLSAKIQLCASHFQLKSHQVQALDAGCEQAQLKQNMRIFLFTFKLACVFLVCSLPYKLAVLLHGLGAHSSFTLITSLGMVRMLYHILDGWTFCANEELLDAMKAMLGCGLWTRSRRTLNPAVQRPTNEQPGQVIIAVLPQPSVPEEGRAGTLDARERGQAVLSQPFVPEEWSDP